MKVKFKKYENYATLEDIDAGETFTFINEGALKVYMMTYDGNVLDLQTGVVFDVGEDCSYSSDERVRKVETELIVY